jgi:hypothetical protein
VPEFENQDLPLICADLRELALVDPVAASELDGLQIWFWFFNSGNFGSYGNFGNSGDVPILAVGILYCVFLD